MNRKLISAVVAAAALLVQAAMSGAMADAQATSHVDSMAATVGSKVNVTGQASFSNFTKLVGEDPADALVPGIGTDIRNIKISRVAPNGKINFTLEIGDQPATLNGMPETVAYYWDITVQNGESSSSYELWAARSAQWAAAGSTNPIFRRYVCVLDPTTGQNTCGTAVNVTGKMADGVVEWQLNASQINAQAGSVITGTAIEVSPTAAGAVWGVVRLDGSGASQSEQFDVPGATVKLGIAPAGTPVENVVLDGVGSVNTSTQTFSGALDKPAAGPGNYIVVAEACFGADNCALSSTPLTVA